jgi:hypothetical protein
MHGVACAVQQVPTLLLLVLLLLLLQVKLSVAVHGVTCAVQQVPTLTLLVLLPAAAAAACAAGEPARCS